MLGGSDKAGKSPLRSQPTTTTARRIWLPLPSLLHPLKPLKKSQTQEKCQGVRDAPDGESLIPLFAQLQALSPRWLNRTAEEENTGTIVKKNVTLWDVCDI